MPRAKKRKLNDGKEVDVVVGDDNKNDDLQTNSNSLGKSDATHLQSKITTISNQNQPTTPSDILKVIFSHLDLKTLLGMFYAIILLFLISFCCFYFSNTKSLFICL